MNSQKPDFQNKYLRSRDINNYLDFLARRYSTFVDVRTIGRTFEGRDIRAIKIDLTVSDAVKTDKCNWIVIEAGTHAREWITTSVALYCIKQLTEKHLRHLNILEKFKFYIIPLVNVDGYEFSHSSNRRWRKNRRPIPKSKSIGTDCNRNYDINWDKGSAKSFKCTYRGDAPFSESETIAIRNVIIKLGANLKFFLSLHSHAQCIMYPWGYKRDIPDTWKQLHKLAECGKNAILKATGRKYRCGNISKITNKLTAGSICDYAFSQKIPYTLVMELPGKCFQPEEQLIESYCQESWIGIKAMCQHVGNAICVNQKKINIKNNVNKVKSFTEFSFYRNGIQSKA